MNELDLYHFKQGMLALGYRDGNNLHSAGYLANPAKEDDLSVQFGLKRMQELGEPSDICFYYGPEELNLIATANDVLASDAFKRTGIKRPRIWFTLKPLQDELVAQVDALAARHGIKVAHSRINQFV
ncbi:MAG: hypothetical protein ACFCBW_00495 [Candidatus Competibacterales bacterium]